MDEFTDLPSIVVTLFVPSAELRDAEAQLHALRAGDTRAELAAAIGRATQHAKGYRVEYLGDGEPPAATPPSQAPLPVVRRLSLLGGRT